ncbi:MAG: hypothetical protein JWR22_1294 [Herminiimonas sp.]|nr:hypothetical protein [Herminiimonas sp.]
MENTSIVPEIPEAHPLSLVARIREDASLLLTQIEAGLSTIQSAADRLPETELIGGSTFCPEVVIKAVASLLQRQADNSWRVIEGLDEVMKSMVGPGATEQTHD